MDTVTTKRTPAKKRTRNFFDHRPTLRASSSHNLTEYKQLPTQPRRTMHSTPRCGDNVIADIVNGSVVRSYVTPMLDSNVSMTVNDGVDNPVYYYNQDERQSVVNLTDDTGVVVQDYGYSAYGDRIDSLRSQVSSLIPNRYTYTGRELSESSGDYYFRYRTYSAGTGSFLSTDPLGYVDGNSMYNGYFAQGVGVDPTGLWKITRKNDQYKAWARATEDYETIYKLGGMIGLDPFEYKKWVTDAGYGVKTVYKKCEAVMIPNTIYSVYNGHFGVVGKWASHYYYQNIKYGLQGFKVIPHSLRPTKDTMLTMLDIYWSSKSLHGFYFMGHGGKEYTRLKQTKGKWAPDPSSFTGSTFLAARANWFFLPGMAANNSQLTGYFYVHSGTKYYSVTGVTDALMDRDVLALRQSYYGLSILKLWACFSRNGKWDQVAAWNASDLDLKNGIYIPIVNIGTGIGGE